MARFLQRLLLGLVLIYAIICLVLFLAQERLLFHAQTLPQDFSFPFTDPFEEFWMDGQNGAITHGILFQSPNPKGVILYLHGNGHTVYEAAENRHLYQQLGFDFFLLDYRTFGKSTGPMSETGLYQDALAGWELLTSLYPDSQIVIIGHSMGTGIAARLAAAQSERALVLISPYYSLQRVASEKYPWVPVPWLLRYEIPTHTYLPETHSPTLLLHGTEDEVIPFAHTQDLIRENPTVTWKAFAGGTHLNLPQFAAYDSTLTAFLQSTGL